MDTTYDVRIWNIRVYRGKRRTTYYVRWTVAGYEKKKPFGSRALADSFRSELMAAARRGEAFDADSGLPVTSQRASRDLSWYAFACEYADLKWPQVAATTRRTHAEVLTTATMALLTSDRGRPDDRVLRSALCRWAFNTARRNAEEPPAAYRAALRWAQSHTRSLSTLRKPEVLRPLLDHLAVTLAGTPAAPTVVNRRRAVLHAALEYAVECSYLPRNPLHELKWQRPKATAGKAVLPVERRRVANPLQVRTLLEAVRQQARSGPRLVAFFGCLYFAGLRPEEAVALTVDHLVLPDEGWGELYPDAAAPHAGKDWTDSGTDRDRRRQLKHRARGQSRPVPCPPDLTALLHEHLRQFGTGPDGLLFVGEQNGRELPKLTILRCWERARAYVFTPEVAASPLAATPYDLRHAALSTWLRAGVPVTQVAEWAGNSVDVLLKTYAKCLDGDQAAWRRQVAHGLGH